MTQAGSIPTVVLGGTGYVAGELLRLIAGHPTLKLAGILSDSQPGEPVAKAFGHLAAVYPDTKFASIDEIEQLVATLPRSAIFSAAPHGASAALIDRLLARAESAGTKPSVVDISADYRYSTDEAYAAVYKHAHGAPQRLKQFTCAVPEHLAKAPTPHVAHPGCFATAILLASVPLLKLGVATPHLFVTGVTGSTGSGRKPVEGTHHPVRHSRHPQGLQILRRDMASAMQQGTRPRQTQQGQARPGAQPLGKPAGLTRGSQQGLQVVQQGRADMDVIDRGLVGLPFADRHHGRQKRQLSSLVGPHQQGSLRLRIGVSQGDPQRKPVQLRLWQRMGAQLLGRVLGGNHKEG